MPSPNPDPYMAKLYLSNPLQEPLVRQVVRAIEPPLQLLQGFRRTLKPGGLLLILIWSSQQLLPGHPRLETLLNATTPGIAPFKKYEPPEYHFLRLLGWLKKAGFVDSSVQPFSAGVHAPLDEGMRKALLALV